jgi:nicotinamide-nucleotide amidase
MNVEILNIGDELLNGTSQNTNATWLCGKASRSGAKVVAVSTVGDDITQITDALDQAGKRADLVIVTGGLGPTSDDKTKDAALQYFGGTLVPVATEIERIRVLFEERGLPLTERNIAQGWIPDTATVFTNPVGTAPGMGFTRGATTWVFLPGVPAEMKRMVEAHEKDWFHHQPTSQTFIFDEVMIIGVGESFVADTLSSWQQRLPDWLSLAYLPSAGLVKIRLSCLHHAPGEARGVIVKALQQVLALFPGDAFHTSGLSWDQYFFQELKFRNRSISAAESCTGGYLSHRITSIPGSSAIFKGGMVTYHNTMKQAWLGVTDQMLEQDGAVSESVVKQMAQEIRKKTDTDFGVAISGIAGPDGATPQKPVGTVWIGIADSDQVSAKMFLMGGDRIRNIEKSAVMAMKMVLNILSISQ